MTESGGFVSVGWAPPPGAQVGGAHPTDTDQIRLGITNPESLTMAESRASILAQFAKIAAGRPIVGRRGTGTGISAKCEEDGRVDLIVVYNSGRYRMAGRGSLAGLMPYGNANQVVKELAPEVLTAVRRTPVLAGVCGTDPFLLSATSSSANLKHLGFAGVQNFPTVGLIDGTFRENLEETGMSFKLEIATASRRRTPLDLLTTPYAFDPAQAPATAHRGRGGRHRRPHGADNLRARSGRRPRSLSTTACGPVGEIAAAAKAVRGPCDVIVLCHGGPIAMPDDPASTSSPGSGKSGVLRGPSSMERLPTELALTAQTEAFKAITF